MLAPRCPRHADHCPNMCVGPTQQQPLPYPHPLPPCCLRWQRAGGGCLLLVRRRVTCVAAAPAAALLPVLQRPRAEPAADPGTPGHVGRLHNRLWAQQSAPITAIDPNPLPPAPGRPPHSLELAMEISLTSLGSSHTLRRPHCSTEAASRFCSLRDTMAAKSGPAAPSDPNTKEGRRTGGLQPCAARVCPSHTNGRLEPQGPTAEWGGGRGWEVVGVALCINTWHRST